MRKKNEDTIPSWVKLRLEPLQGTTTRFLPDAILEVTPKQGTHPIRYAVELKRRLSYDDAQRMADVVAHHHDDDDHHHILVVTNRLTDSSRQVLQQAGVSWVERDTGRTHLQGPGLLIDVVRPSSVSSDSKGHGSHATKLTGRSGTVAETILLRFPDKPISVTELAKAADVSTGLASRILQRLDREGVVHTVGKGPAKRRILSAPDKLLDVWARENSKKPDRVTAVHVWARTVGALYGRLEEKLSPDGSWALGGVAAANLYAPSLSRLPQPIVWIGATESPEDFADRLGGNLVEQGSTLTLWQTEGDPALVHAGLHGGWIRQIRLMLVSPIRAYVEALSGAGRAPDVAEGLRQKMETGLGSNIPQ